MRIPLLASLSLFFGCEPAKEGCPGEQAAAGAVVVALETRDGFCLSADHHPAGAGRPGIVLLHMNPQSYDRGSWPSSFIGALAEQDWHVLNVDRRGAGASEGEAEDAFLGDGGRFDVEAAAAFYAKNGVAPIALIGASNGTTSAVDYTTWAPTVAGLPLPAGVVLLSGGSYTESQTSMAEYAATLTTTLLVNDPSGDPDSAAWEADIENLDPVRWTFEDLDGAGHGTAILTGAPESGATIVDFLAPLLEI